MSGHSKWHSIRHKKAITDNKRGKLFTKLIKEISIAAKINGGDPLINSRLRLAISKAKEANMPSENIDRAIKKGTGELEGINYEEIIYEGYGSFGIAFMLEILTDNRNRTVAELRKIFSKYDGRLGENGSVNWMFKTYGIITLQKLELKEEKIIEIAIDAGAYDIKIENSYIIIYTEPKNFESVKEILKKNKNIKIEHSEIIRIANNIIQLENDKYKKNIALLEILEDHDDVQNVSTNLNIK